MRTIVVLLFMLAAAILVPAAASAGIASLEMREIPLRGERVPAAVPARFDFVGLHWQGAGTVEFRTRSADGGWSGWRLAEHDRGHAPDAREPMRRGWIAGDGVWAGPSVSLQVRTRGDVHRVRALTVRSPVVLIPLRTTAAAGEPGVVSRASWQADETLRRGEPRYAGSLRMAYVHHTATRSDYSPAESAAIVRAIQVYHVKGNGWNDIGYNALVDRFGTVFEGRYGGLARNVVGAHARGFNTGSFGVSVIGDFTRADPPPAALSALVGLLSWRLDLAHVDPASTFTAVATGNERFAPGQTVSLAAISGHRDTGATTCPGERLYARLPALRAQVAATGLPKLYEPVVEGSLGGPVRFRARLSGAIPWVVTVTDARGTEVASGRATGRAVDWTWDASAARAGTYDWRIEAAGATPATGTLGTTAPTVPVAIAIEGATAELEAISPNGDGHADATSITFVTSAAANVSASVLAADGVAVAQILEPRWRRAGEHRLPFDGASLPDGRYTVRLLAKVSPDTEASAEVPIAISRTLTAPLVLPALLTPNGDGRGDRVQIRFRLAREATVRVRLFRDGAWVATALAGRAEKGLQVVTWDGSKRVGRARDGAYEAVVEATDEVATTSAAAPFALDATAPLVRLRARRPPVLWVGEAGRLTVRVNGAVRRVVVREPGEVRLRGIRELRSLVVTARDRAGNRSAPLRYP